MKWPKITKKGIIRIVRDTILFFISLYAFSYLLNFIGWGFDSFIDYPIYTLFFSFFMTLLLRFLEKEEKEVKKIEDDLKKYYD